MWDRWELRSHLSIVPEPLQAQFHQIDPLAPVIIG